jgi:hypothetical protein
VIAGMLGWFMPTRFFQPTGIELIQALRASGYVAHFRPRR